MLAVFPAALRALPETWAFGFSRWFSRLSRASRKRLIFSRLDCVLGPHALSPAARNEFWEAHLTHVGRTFVESFHLWAMSDAEILERITIEGEHHLHAALAGGRGAILFLNHLGNPGAIVCGLGIRDYDLTMAGNRMEATVLGETVALDYAESVVQRMFRRARVRRALLGENLPQRLAESLDNNGLFAMFIDFPVVRKHNARVAFGAGEMNVNLGPALLAMRHASPVLCVECRRTGDNRHHLVIHPPLGAASETDRKVAASRTISDALALLLPALRSSPEQWWPWDWAEVTPAIHQ